MKIKSLLALLAVLLTASGTFALGGSIGPGVRFSSQVSQQGTIGTSTNAVVLPLNPVVSFCNFPASGTPCANKATTYTDASLAVACSTSTQIVLDGTNTCVANPDAQNNWGVWLVPGQYTYTITIGTSNFGPFFVSAPMGANNNAFYVGGLQGPVFWGVTDIMAQINAAQSKAPADGGTIYVLPQPGGGCYLTNGSTTFTANTIGKYFQIIGTAPIVDTSGQIISGSCIQDTSVSAHNLFTIDWSPAAGGGYVPGAGIQNLAIVNSASGGSGTQCNTTGGCASAANAVVIGGTNGGAFQGFFQNILIKGFNQGFLLQDAAGIGWGIRISHSSFANNTLGINDTVGHENLYLDDVTFAVNGNPGKFNCTGSQCEVTLTGGHTDSNVAGWLLLGSQLWRSQGHHFENQGIGAIGTDVSYVSGPSGSAILSIGDDFVDDSSTGSTSQSYLAAGHVTVSGSQFAGNAGRTYTGVIFNGSTDTIVSGRNASTGQFGANVHLNNICPPANCTMSISDNAGNNSTFDVDPVTTPTFTDFGRPTNGSTFTLHDATSGGTIIAVVDVNATNVALIGQTGSVIFVVGAPGAAQMGVQYNAGTKKLQISCGAGATGHHIHYTQVQTQ